MKLVLILRLCNVKFFPRFSLRHQIMCFKIITKIEEKLLMKPKNTLWSLNSKNININLKIILNPGFSKLNYE
jgi:hypothetical protein